MGSKLWVKLWVQTLDDPKLGQLDDRLWRRFIELLLCAGKFDQGGKLPPKKDLLWMLRVSSEDLDKDETALAEAGFIKDHAIVNWEKYQGQSPGAKRQAKYRAKKDVTDNVTSDNHSDVTGSASPSTSTSTSLINNNVFKSYEAEIGILTPKIAEEIKAAIGDYPEDWIIAAYGEAARHNKRAWSYIQAILKRWKVEGFQSNTKGKPKEKKTEADYLGDYQSPEPGSNGSWRPEYNLDKENIRRWESAIEDLEREMPKSAYDKYVAHLYPLEITDNVLFVETEYYDWVQARLHPTLSRIYAAWEMQIKFVRAGEMESLP